MSATVGPRRKWGALARNLRRPATLPVSGAVLPVFILFLLYPFFGVFTGVRDWPIALLGHVVSMLGFLFGIPAERNTRS